MAVGKGWVRIDRGIWDHPVFQSHREAAVFVWMITEAGWKAERTRTHVGPVALGVGELVVSERDMAEQFDMTRDALRRLLARMAKDGMIVQTPLQRQHAGAPSRRAFGTIITVVNYASYQNVESLISAPPNRTTTISQPLANHQPTTLNNDNKKQGNKGQDSPPIPPLVAAATAGVAAGADNTSEAGIRAAAPLPVKKPARQARFAEMDESMRDDFQRWYAAYGLNVGKKDASAAYQKARKAGVEAAVLLEATRRYVLVTPANLRAGPANWLKGERWLDDPVDRSKPGRPRDDGLDWLRALRGGAGDGASHAVIDAEVVPA